jgi:hypothetical protein
MASMWTPVYLFLGVLVQVIVNRTFDLTLCSLGLIFQYPHASQYACHALQAHAPRSLSFALNCLTFLYILNFSGACVVPQHGNPVFSGQETNVLEIRSEI